MNFTSWRNNRQYSMIAAESGTVTLVLKQKKSSESHRNIGFYVFKAKEGKQTFICHSC